jgi:hypothetical protein
MRHVKESSNKKVLEFSMPKDGIGAQQVNWVRGVVAPGPVWAGESIVIPQSDHRS